MKFAAIDARMPIELLVLRMTSAVETPEERANLRAAWKQCLEHGPSAPRRKVAKRLPPPPPAPFTAEMAAV